MRKGKRFWSSNRWLGALIPMILFFGISTPLFASDLEAIRADVAFFVTAVHGKQSMSEYKTLCGFWDNSDQLLMESVCESLGHDTTSDQCVAYSRCREKDPLNTRSYYLAALSTIVPNAKLAEITIEEGKWEKTELPYVFVHAKIGEDLFTFYRVTKPTYQVPFGKLIPIKVNHKKIDLSSANLMEVFNSDPCRDALLIPPIVPPPYKMDAVREDVDLFFSTIHGSRSLKDHYYLNGVGGEIELEFELAVCEELGFDSSSEDCIKYLRCRYGKSAMCTSYSMTAESSVIPVVSKDAPKKIVVEYLGAEQIPNMLVHVEVDGHVFVFSRVADKDVAIQFGHLALVELDGQDIMPPPVALMEVFNSDPCRRILLDKQ